MFPLRGVQLQGAGDGVEDAGRHPGELAALEPSVVLDAHPGEAGDLAAAQSGHPALSDDGHAGLLGGDLRAAGGEELAYFGSVVHGVHGSSDAVGVGCPVDTPHRGDFSRVRVRAMLVVTQGVSPIRSIEETAHARSGDVRAR